MCMFVFVAIIPLQIRRADLPILKNNAFCMRMLSWYLPEPTRVVVGGFAVVLERLA